MSEPRFKVGDRVRDRITGQGVGRVVSAHRGYVYVVFGAHYAPPDRYLYHVSNLEPATDILVSDLTTDELAHWLASWVLCTQAAADIDPHEAHEDSGTCFDCFLCEDDPDEEDREWTNLRDELLAEYAARSEREAKS